MPASLRSVPGALSLLTLALAACGPSPEKAGATQAAESVKSDTPVSPEAPPTAPPTTPQLSMPQRTAHASPVPDPPWFSPALLPGATVTKKGRSPADDQGRFTANILFALPAGATLDDCVRPLSEQLAKIVPTVAREEKDGRVTLSGDTPDQHVMVICGEAKGTMSAFVSYRWTQPPPPAR